MKKIRLMMRGYANLKKTGQLGRIMDAQIALVETPLEIPRDQMSKTIFGAAFEKGNEAVREILFSRVGLYSLNKALLVSKGKKNGQVVHPLPKKYRDNLHLLGWQVSDEKCEFLWRGFTLICLGHGIFLLIKQIILGLYLLLNPNATTHKKYVYFAGLTKMKYPMGKKAKVMM